MVSLLTPEPVSTAALKNRMPTWMELTVPDSVPLPWHKLIDAFGLISLAAWEASPPERLSLKVVRVGTCLAFSHELPAETEEKYPMTVEMLAALAGRFGSLSGLLYAAERYDSSCSEVGRDIAASSSEPPLKLRQRSLFQCDAGDVDPADEAPSGDPDHNNGRCRMVPVFSWTDALLTDGGRRRGRDADSAARIESLTTRLRWSGPTRPLRAPVTSWESSVDALASDFPNFAHLIAAVIRPHLSLLSRGYMHRMNSVLLVGPPGIGKTFFAQQLADIMNVGRAMFISMVSETNGSSLAGSSTFWSNASPGRLFERLAWGDAGGCAVANPLVILDEVDKTSTDRYDPLGPLYELLEAETARSFQDQSLPDVFIDASHVRFFATANDITAIPQPLLSRTLVFHIAPPNHDQQRRVVQRMYEGIVSRIGIRMRTQLPVAVMERAVRLSPREAKVRLECAVARASSGSRDYLLPEDWLDVELGQDGQRKIGFTN